MTALLATALPELSAAGKAVAAAAVSPATVKIGKIIVKSAGSSS